MLSLEKKKTPKGLRDWYQTLDPSTRKKVTLIGGVVAIFAVSAIIITTTSDTSPRRSVQKARKVEYTLFNGKSPREVSIDAMGGKIKKLTDDMSEIRGTFQRQDQKIKDASELIEKRSGELDKRTETLARQTTEFNQRLDELKNSVDNQVPLMPIVDKPSGKSGTGGKASGFNARQELSGNPPTIAESEVAPESQPKIRVVTASGEEVKKNRAGEVGGADGTKKPGDKKITEFVNIKQASGKNGTPDMFLPAGSILSGTLVTGLDAPTSNQSKQDPFPALLRVKHEAILPNRYRMDIRECFLIASGFGDLSAERAYMRAERISCVKKDGAIIETAIDAYSVGEDGKAGVRGRLVSKNGQIIGNALLSGFVSGITNAFAPQKVQSLNTRATPGQSQLFQYPSPEMIAGQALMGGVKGAAEQIADYYLEMAKNIFPVIEIDAGRKLDFIMIRGISLTPKSKSNQNQGINLQGGTRSLNNLYSGNQDNGNQDTMPGGMMNNMLSGHRGSRGGQSGNGRDGGSSTNDSYR